ncbi:MAG TPA: response regulator [Aliidongia sp.]|uniref:response regulator n=1 Tax=Aliidongia sp. TaxID=1914230 RepID=UPI002DDD6708|nr:response regulator [Aliidongia sp.]HEV2675612.1 response regulator [Aliidongia sp.]
MSNHPPAPPAPASRIDAPTAGLAHDFNNLLLAMTACLELIEGRSSEAKIVSIARHGLDTIDRGAQLVERLLALGRSGSTDRPAPPPPVERVAVQAPSRPQSTVLVVDDDADVRLVLVELLQSLGYRPVEASNGPDGIAASERDPLPDLAIIDYALPGLNGGEVATELRARRPELPIVIATGHSDVQALDPRWRHLPMLHKPFRIADLAQTIASALESDHPPK